MEIESVNPDWPSSPETPPLTQKGHRQGEQDRYLEIFEKCALAIIGYVQVIVLVGIGWFGIHYGAWLWAVMIALVGYLVPAILLDWAVYRQIRIPGQLKLRSRLGLLMLAGVLLVILIPFLGAEALLIRVTAQQPWKFWLAGLASIALGVLMFLAAYSSLRAERAPWLAFGVALVVCPLILGWGAGSLVWWAGVWWEARASTQSPAGRQGGDTVQDARQLARCQDGGMWLKDGKPLTVAVALSGGGYRAAITHAGVLVALEERCVPIRYVSTVSGGSIIGAYYALGFPPHEFAKRLHGGKPGLPNDMFEISAVLRDWFDPRYTSADTYSHHFRRAWFADTTLKDLQDYPLLIVNATDLEAEGESSREIFFKGGIDTDRPQGTLIADVVAASGAFPGFFHPKRVRWPRVHKDPSSPGQLEERPFIDGGVVENLGFDGLRQFLALPRPRHVSPPDLPHLMIVSDASRRADPARFRGKIDPLTLLLRSQGLSYDALHRHLYARYTAQSDFFESIRTLSVREQVGLTSYWLIDRRLWERTPSTLLTVTIPLTARETATLLIQYGQCQFSSDLAIAEVQQRVATIDTLAELSPEQVEEGFWLGYALGTIYWPAIDCARFQILNPGKACPPWDLKPQDVTCPSSKELTRPFRPTSAR